MTDFLYIIRKKEIIEVPIKTHQRFTLIYNFTALIFCHQQMERLKWICYTSGLKEAQYEILKDFPGNTVTRVSMGILQINTQGKTEHKAWYMYCFSLLKFKLPT